jgi:hypothetical protein
MTLKLYRYHEDFGRMGYLSGTFVADDKDVAKVFDDSVYLGEVLGKHSDINAYIDDKTLTILTDDQDFIRKFLMYQCGSGHNPVAAFLEQ